MVLGQFDPCLKTEAREAKLPRVLLEQGDHSPQDAASLLLGIDRQFGQIHHVSGDGTETAADQMRAAKRQDKDLGSRLFPERVRCHPVQ